MFLLSVFLILISTYFIFSVIFKSSNNVKIPGFIYLFLIAYSQIVISFEILSLFGLISKKPLLICNMIFFIGASILWILNKFPIYRPKFLPEFKKIFKALKRDKLLFFLGICFVIFIISNLILALIHPVTFGDALAYYLPRVTAWIQQGSIAHFVTPDSRELIMPVNMEFLYTWYLMFNKIEFGLSIFPFLGFLLQLYVLYNFLGDLGFSRRKRLFSIFVVSSFIEFSLMSYIPCADLFIGALLLSTLYLFYIYLRNDSNIPLYFAALASALAFGTKTTSLIAFPSIFILLIVMGLLFNKQKLKKGILYFILFTFVNFMIFSSYNYFLNFIEFHNPISCNEQLLLNKFRGGFKGFICNLIRYIFMFFDSSGIKNIDLYNVYITKAMTKILAIIGEGPESYTSKLFKGYFEFNKSNEICHSGLGLVGVLAFIPAFIISIFKLFCKNASKKIRFLSALALSLVFNIVLFSRVMLYTQYNFRYLVTFICIASPIVVFVYIKSNKNLYKWVLSYFMFVYLFVIAHTIPSVLIYQYIQMKKEYPEIRSIYESILLDDEALLIYWYFIKKGNTSIGVMSYRNNDATYYLLKPRLFGYKVDRILWEDTDKIDEYDYIITNIHASFSSYIIKKGQKNCLALDYQGNITNVKKNPAFMTCITDSKFFKEKGFKLINKINNQPLKQFSIWENTKKKH